MRLSVTALALAGTIACGSPGTPPAGTVSRVGVSSGAGTLGITELHNEPGRSVHELPVPFDSVWRALPRAYELIGVEPAALPAERLIGARGFQPRRIEDRRLSSFIDCGTGPTATPRADEYQVTMTLLSKLDSTGPASTVLETTLSATARPRDRASSPIVCQSNGALESRVAELVAYMLLPDTARTEAGRSPAR